MNWPSGRFPGVWCPVLVIISYNGQQVRLHRTRVTFADFCWLTPMRNHTLIQLTKLCFQNSHHLFSVWIFLRPGFMCITCVTNTLLLTIKFSFIISSVPPPATSLMFISEVIIKNLCVSTGQPTNPFRNVLLITARYIFRAVSRAVSQCITF